MNDTCEHVETSRAQSQDFIDGKIEELQQCCRDTGLKLTQQRVEILRELASTKEHPSAEMVHQRVRERMPGVSLDTVYRTLGTFEKLGLVDKLNVSQEQSRYDADRSRHHHMVCRCCKEIFDFHWNDMQQLQLPEDVTQWGRPDGLHVVVTGLCRKCLEEERSREQA